MLFSISGYEIPQQILPVGRIDEEPTRGWTTVTIAAYKEGRNAGDYQEETDGGAVFHDLRKSMLAHNLLGQYLIFMVANSRSAIRV